MTSKFSLFCKDDPEISDEWKNIPLVPGEKITLGRVCFHNPVSKVYVSKNQLEIVLLGANTLVTLV